MKKVDLYTDGACSGNPGPGGWGFVLLFGKYKKELSGYEEHTTNNRMELLAAISGLQQLKEPCEVNLYSDSAYLINCFNNGWIYNWSKNGWKTSTGSAVQNKDLWEILFTLHNTHKIKFIKVKGHADNEYNNLCDTLATSAIKDNR